MKLKDLRKKAKKTQEQAGKILNVSGNVYGKYEHGERNMSVEMYNRLAKYYNTSIEYLIGEDANEK